MMQSPEQQFALAKRLPISELAKVLQGQSDIVDMSTAQMMLRQKIQAQKAQQGAAAVQMAQGPRVVEKDLAEAGVAALPVGGIGEIGNYTGAGGGIVAFDDGGPVQHYQNQGLVRGNQLSLFPELADEAAAAVPESRRASFMQALRKMFGLKGLGALSAVTYPTYKLLDTGMDYDTGMGYGDIGEQMTIGTPLQSPRERSVDKAAETKKEDKKEVVAQDVSDKAQKPSDSAVAKEEVGLGSLVDKFYGPEKKAKTLQDITQERLNLYKQLGIDADPYAAAIENIQKDRETDAEARREAGWSRLLEAGLGIMGGESPYALTNIGRGAQAAAKGAAEDMKEFRKLERERKKAESDYKLAANAYRKSGADSDLATAEKERTRVDNINMKRSDAALTVAVEQIKLKAQREGRLEERDLKLYLGALEQAGNMVKNNFDTTAMSLEDIQKAVNAQAAAIYNQYKAGNFGAGASASNKDAILAEMKRRGLQ